MSSKLVMSLLCAGSLGVAPSVWSQETPPVSGDEQAAAAEPAAAANAAAPRAASRLIEEIVVTAQKREENIQEVPIAITAFSAEKLEALGIQNVQELERITPGLTVTYAGGFPLVYLRGVGTDAFLPGADPSVPFYVDGVALLSGQGTSDTLGRVKRVEVLKGPQGTLFGRNATGGAVNIITPDPDNVFAGDVGVEYGNYNTSKVTAYANLPFTDSIAASIAVNSYQQDNFYKNDGTGGVADVYSRGGRAKLRWQATDDFAVTLAGSLQKSSSNGGLNFENTRVAPIFAAVIPEDPKADRHINTDDISSAIFNSRLLSATFDWHLPWVDVKVIGSDQLLDNDFVQADFDKSYLPIINIQSLKQKNKQRTVELQFLSNEETPFGDKLEWVAGLFYLESSGGYDPIAFEVAPGAIQTLSSVLTGTPQAPLFNGLTNVLNTLLTPLSINLNNGVRLLNHGVLESEAYSAYLQGTYHFTDAFNVTAGVRYQDERRNLERARTTVPTAAGEVNVIPLTGTLDLDELSSKKLSPRIALQLKPFEDDAQIYASWGRAFKSPTYNTVNLLGGLPTTIGGVLTGQLELPEVKPVKAEQVDSYELGIKTDLFDRNLRLNAAAFYTKQKDLLTGFVGVLTGGIVSYANAPGAEIKGFETDVLWTPMPELNPGFVVTGALSVLDAKYTDYPNGKGFDETTGIAFGDGDTSPGAARDFKGNRIVRTPKYTYNIGLSQTVEVPSGSIELGADLNYNDGFYFLAQNSDLYARGANTLVNARVNYLYDPWGLQVGVFCLNVTDETYNEAVFVDDFGRNQILNNPRTYGVRAKLEF